MKKCINNGIVNHKMYFECKSAFSVKEDAFKIKITWFLRKIIFFIEFSYFFSRCK